MSFGYLASKVALSTFKASTTMGVIKRGNSKFWYIQFQYNGRTFIKSSKTSDKRLAEVMEANWRKQLVEQNVFGSKERVTLKTALSMFCDSKTQLASYSHLVRYTKVVLDLLASKKYIDEITSSDLERIRLNRIQLGYSTQTIKHIFNAVRGTTKYMSRMGYRVSEVEYPKITLSKGKLRYLTFDEEKRLLEANNPARLVKGMPPYGQRPKNTQREMDDLYDFLVMLLDTGARYSELSALTWQQINLTEKTISLWRPKVKNESILFMTDRLYQILTIRHNKKTSKFVFENSTGGARNYIPSTLRRTFSRAGLPDCTAHTLRHTHATRLIQNGLNLYEVKEILGHADIKTTMRYAHIEQRSVSIKAREVINRLNKEQSFA